MQSDELCTPPELHEVAESAVSNLLPKKSAELYKKEFTNFETWCEENKVQGISENVLIAYFDMQSKKKKSSTLWSMYSMLRSCLNIYKNVDISKYKKLQAFLKKTPEEYEPKKSKILEVEDIYRFTKEADDKMYLAIKVALIMEYNGACRRDELVKMLVDHIEYKNDTILVSIPKTKTKVSRLFAVTNNEWINQVIKYINLRPKNVTHRRLFDTYRNGYCINSPIGINTIGKMPMIIATFLKLPNPELFTGHCFRRSSVSHLANKGGDFVTIKRHGGWKSSTVAEGYIEQSLQRKVEVAQILSTGNPSTSNVSSFQPHESIVVADNTSVEQNYVTKNLPGIIINASDSCSVTINIYNDGKH